ncbi:hypothetical protein [Microbacterium sp. Se5.02b]|uniref:hypothetical protein n=1 Tax=Microbacterium sp. Se5.02b TaxID=2864103 RepID=UPI001C68ED72|nr:hypothetical protein [Microbacterium sp. Se5.02b]QYM63364.1 hypothetical protein K1X59_14120 [Microbacterium sp. Se5.02b]
MSLSELISTTALALSAVAIFITLAWRQRPFIRVEFSDLKDNSETSQPRWRIRVSNRGNGEAWDVRIRVLPGDGLDEVWTIGTLKPDESHDQEFMVTPFVDLGEGSGIWADGKVDPRSLKAVVRWRALPFIRWYRRKTVRVGTQTENLVWYREE